MDTAVILSQQWAQSTPIASGGARVSTGVSGTTAVASIASRAAGASRACCSLRYRQSSGSSWSAAHARSRHTLWWTSIHITLPARMEINASSGALLSVVIPHLGKGGLALWSRLPATPSLSIRAAGAWIVTSKYAALLTATISSCIALYRKHTFCWRPGFLCSAPRLPRSRLSCHVRVVCLCWWPPALLRRRKGAAECSVPVLHPVADAALCRRRLEHVFSEFFQSGHG